MLFFENEENGEDVPVDVPERRKLKKSREQIKRERKKYRPYVQQ